jgi:hypothetical protein
MIHIHWPLFLASCGVFVSSSIQAVRRVKLPPDYFVDQLSKQLDKELRGKKVEKKRVMGIEPSFDVLTKLEVSKKYIRRCGIACPHLYSPCALTLHNQPLNEVWCPVVS